MALLPPYSYSISVVNHSTINDVQKTIVQLLNTNAESYITPTLYNMLYNI